MCVLWELLRRLKPARAAGFRDFALCALLRQSYASELLRRIVTPGFLAGRALLKVVAALVFCLFTLFGS
jgi:hypothetical protein